MVITHRIGGKQEKVCLYLNYYVVLI